MMKHILYAWSEDGIAWNKHTAFPMLEPGNTGQWDENDYPSGIYYYLLSIENEKMVSKMLL